MTFDEWLAANAPAESDQRWSETIADDGLSVTFEWTQSHGVGISRHTLTVATPEPVIALPEPPWSYYHESRTMAQYEFRSVAIQLFREWADAEIAKLESEASE